MLLSIILHAAVRSVGSIDPLINHIERCSQPGPAACSSVCRSGGSYASCTATSARSACTLHKSAHPCPTCDANHRRQPTQDPRSPPEPEASSIDASTGVPWRMDQFLPNFCTYLLFSSRADKLTY